MSNRRYYLPMFSLYLISFSGRDKSPLACTSIINVNEREEIKKIIRHKLGKQRSVLILVLKSQRYKTFFMSFLTSIIYVKINTFVEMTVKHCKMSGHMFHLSIYHGLQKHFRGKKSTQRTKNDKIFFIWTNIMVFISFKWKSVPGHILSR